MLQYLFFSLRHFGHFWLQYLGQQAFFKENIRHPVWSCRDPIYLKGPIFSDSTDPMIISSDSRDPICNSRDPSRVPETPLKSLGH